MSRVPDQCRVYAIGDIHGRIDLLGSLLVRVEAHLKAAPIPNPIHVFLGDYIDRGPHSRSVIEQLIEWGHQNPTVCLKGNHEVMLTEFLKEPRVLEEWRQYGGLETLVSYGLHPAGPLTANRMAEFALQLEQVLPDRHRRFLSELKNFFVCGDYYFVHAGVRPGIALERQQPQDQLWIRNEFLNSDEKFGKIIVHGHTPRTEPEVLPNRINIDTGAYATGRLTCVVLETDKIEFL